MRSIGISISNVWLDASESAGVMVWEGEAAAEPRHVYWKNGCFFIMLPEPCEAFMNEAFTVETTVGRRLYRVGKLAPVTGLIWAVAEVGTNGVVARVPDRRLAGAVSSA